MAGEGSSSNGVEPATSAAPSQATSPTAPHYNMRPTDPDVVRVTWEEVKGGQGMPRLQARVQIEAMEEGTSSMSSVFLLCNSAIGAGVLSLPYAFRCAGVIGCLLLCVLFAACEGFTLYVLAKFAERYSAPTYGSLVRKALGRKLSAALSIILFIYLAGSCVAYLVIIGDTFSSLMALHLGADSMLADRQAILLAVTLLVILPMCFPRNLSAMEWVSLGAVVGFAYTSIAILVRGTQIVIEREDHFEGVKLFVWDISALYAVSIIVFGFNSHPNVVSIFAELDHFPHRLISQLPSSLTQFHAMSSWAPKPYTYKLLGMLGVICCAYAVISAGYMAVGIAGYLAFPTSVGSNVLNTFPTSDILMQVARAVIGIVVVGHYPLNHHPARHAFEDLLHALFNINRVSPWLSALITVMFVGGTLSIALVVTDLGAVLHMIGGTAASLMIFAIPGLLLMNAAIIKHTVLQETFEDDEAPPVASLPSDSELSAPLIVQSKTAGIRDSGFVFAPRKSWWIGLALVVLSLAVFTNTIVTAVIKHT